MFFNVIGYALREWDTGVKMLASRTNSHLNSLIKRCKRVAGAGFGDRVVVEDHGDVMPGFRVGTVEE